MATAGQPPLSVVHALPMNYNVPPPIIPLAESAPQFTYVTVAHVLPSASVPMNAVPMNVVWCIVSNSIVCLCY